MYWKRLNGLLLMVMVLFFIGCGGAEGSFNQSLESYSEKIVYSDGEDNTTQGWRIDDNTPSGASIENIYDELKANRVIKLSGNGIDNSYIIGGEGTPESWNNQNEHVLQWSMNYDEAYIIYVQIMTENGSRLIIYEAKDDYELKINGSFILLGIGSDSNDGTWRNFSRDLDKDFKKVEPDNAIIAVNGFIIRGSGLIDDIKLVENNFEGWRVDDAVPAVASIESVYDSIKQENVIKLNGDGIENAYMLGGWENSSEAWNNKEDHVLQWSMKYSENYTIYVRVITEDGARFIIYEAKDDYEQQVSGNYILLGIGSNSINGTWQTFTRDLDADFQRVEPTNSIIAINGFLIRGSGLIDDVVLIKNNTVYSNAEDNSTNGWRVSDDTPMGATISNIYDANRQSRVIELKGNGIENAYIIGDLDNSSKAWKNKYHHKLHWSMNFDESYIIYVRVMTEDGARLIIYEAKDDYELKINGSFILLGIGSNSIDGTWHDFSRDLDADFQRVEPNNSIIEVNGFLIRGSGLIDNLELKLENNNVQ